MLCDIIARATWVPIFSVTFGTTFGTISVLFECAGSNPARAFHLKKKKKNFFLKGKKFGTLHVIACHLCARSHANLLCIVPTLLHVLPKSQYNGETRY